MTDKQKCSILRVPFGLGAGRDGAQLGPEAILHIGLKRNLTQLSIAFEDEGEVSVPAVAQKNLVSGLKNLAEVAQVNTELADKVSSIVEKGNFPLVLGGDHSIAIGTIAGLAEQYNNLGVIWIDAHSDLNTAQTSPSGNIHGMSLGVSLGNGDELLTSIKGAHPKIKPENIVIIGARQLDIAEKELIRTNGIHCFTMYDIDRMGMAQVIEETLSILKDTDGIHVSFDIDSVDPEEAPGTGTPVKGGLNYREAHFALEFLNESGKVTSAEFVEVNPKLDADNKTARLAAELINSLLGKRIL